MPPRTIIKTGKKVGFKAFKIYPHTSSNAIVYGKTSRGGFLGRLFRWSPIRIIAAIFVIIFYKKFSGIVLMMK
jgi:hypothetical protein